MHNNDQIFTGYKPDKPVSEEIRYVRYESKFYSATHNKHQ